MKRTYIKTIQKLFLIIQNECSFIHVDITRHFCHDFLTSGAEFTGARGGQDSAPRTRTQLTAGEGGDKVRVGVGAGNDGAFPAPLFGNLGWKTKLGDF